MNAPRAVEAIAEGLRRFGFAPNASFALAARKPAWNKRFAYRGDMAELVDASDLKSLGPRPSGFDSRCPHHPPPMGAAACHKSFMSGR